MLEERQNSSPLVTEAQDPSTKLDLIIKDNNSSETKSPWNQETSISRCYWQLAKLHKCLAEELHNKLNFKELSIWAFINFLHPFIRFIFLGRTEDGSDSLQPHQISEELHDRCGHPNQTCHKALPC